MRKRMGMGKDGFPIPKPNQQMLNRYTCLCPVCIGANATMTVAKNANWVVRCPTCQIILYLNDITSMNLFRGFQKFFDNDPEHQVAHTAGIIKYEVKKGDFATVAAFDGDLTPLIQPFETFYFYKNVLAVAK